MASFNIHLAIGKRYIEKNSNINNIEEFYKGIIDPDLAINKKVSHYSGKQNKSNILEYLANKVLLNEFLSKETIDTDYQKGIFIHLITDYLFFNNFFEKEYLKNIKYDEFCKNLYYSYNKTNQYIEEKYKIDYLKYADQINNNIDKDNKEKNTISKIGNNILPYNKLDNFIEYVSNINLEEYKNNIIKFRKNILPT